MARRLDHGLDLRRKRFRPQAGKDVLEAHLHMNAERKHQVQQLQGLRVAVCRQADHGRPERQRRRQLRHDLGRTVGAQIGVGRDQIELFLELGLGGCAQAHERFALDGIGLQVGELQQRFLGAVSGAKQQALDQLGEAGRDARSVGPELEVGGFVEPGFGSVQGRPGEGADNGCSAEDEGVGGDYCATDAPADASTDASTDAPADSSTHFDSPVG
ncbi:hypothetical protein FQZ97_765700 [compost metagenome]